MSKIVIVGDSLAYNRPDGIENSLRWPQLLVDSLGSTFMVENLSMGSSTSQRFNQLKSITLNNDDILIVQIGIVDCAPRLFTRFENRIIARIPHIFAKRIISYFKKIRIQSGNRAYVSPDEFDKNVSQLFRDFKHVRMIYIKILPGGSKFISSNLNVNDSIEKYNSIIDRNAEGFNNVKIVNFDSAYIDQCTLEDGYHLNVEGHLLISNLVLEQILKKEI